MKRDLRVADRYKGVLGHTFRLSPTYRICPYERLSGVDAEAYKQLRTDDAFYGILEPRGSGGTIKAISVDTALLLHTLESEGPLPDYVCRREADLPGVESEIVAMVLDGILEVETRVGFVSGEEAVSAMEWRIAATTVTNQPLTASLSHAAIRHAAKYRTLETARLSARLYFYNRLPVSPRLAEAFPDADSVVNFLGVKARNGSGIPGFRGGRPRDGWLLFERTDEPARSPYKLYVNVSISELPDAFESFRVATEFLKPSRFKLGTDAFGLARPDKFVAYFETYADLSKFANRLLPGIDACSVHGVPFTAAWHGNAVLSWGRDPNHDKATPGWLEKESHRLRLTNLIATYLDNASTPDPLGFVLSRLQLAGVDTDTWITDAEKTID